MTEPADIQRRLDDIINQAKAGNSEAQYALAVILSRRPATLDQSLHWMQKAIEAGHAGAAFTLGAWYIQGITVSPDYVKGHALVKRAADMKFEDAIVLRSVLTATGIGVTANWAEAFRLVWEHARTGGARCLSQLAFLCWMSDQPSLRGEGDKLLSLAADAFDGVALYTRAQRTLAASPTSEMRARALFDLAIAGQILHHPLAENDPRIHNMVVTPPLPRRDIDLAVIHWDLLRANLGSVPPVPRLAPVQVHCEDPYVAVVPHFLSPEECDWLIARAQPHLRPSQVTDPITGKNISLDYRSSHDMRFWHVFQDLVVHCINLRIAQASAEPLSHQEMLGVLRYLPGEEYKPHGDFLTPDAQGHNPEVERSGQRIKTFLTYLNDNYDGGETAFLHLHLTIKGHKGDGLLFRNVTPDGAPDPRTIHAGLPIRKGVKWLSTIWIRAAQYRYRD